MDLSFFRVGEILYDLVTTPKMLFTAKTNKRNMYSSFKGHNIWETNVEEISLKTKKKPKKQ